MKHSGTQTIETQRLLLRKFTTDDAQAMFDNWASDPEVTKFMTWPPYEKVEWAKDYLQYVSDTYSSENSYYWAIVLKDLGEPVGAISVVSASDDALWMEIGYGIGRKWWHRGITSEAMAAVIDYLFESTDVNRIQASHDIRNVNSGKVMLKCGLKYEGTLRQHGCNNQGICDSAFYSILRDEWEKK